MTTAEKLIKVAENVPKVYEAGFEAGKAEGEGDSWYDTFWDNLQENGDRTRYGTVSSSGFFIGGAWNDVTFNPKYDIVPTEQYEMFGHSAITNLANLKVNLDFSKCVDMRIAFLNCKELQHVGVIDCSSVKYSWANRMFDGCSALHTIEKFIFSNSTLLTSGAYGNTFKNCTALANVVADGTCHFSIDFKVSPLTATSAKSFINCLANYAGTENEFKYTITFSETTWGYLDAEGNASPNDNSWREYINDLGWNAS